MPKRRLDWLALVVTLALAMPHPMSSGYAQDAPTAESCGDVLVATGPLTPSSPLVSNEVVLSTPRGDLVSSLPFEEPAEIIPTAHGARALVRSLGNEYGVLDLSTNAVTMLDFDGADAGSVTHRSFLFANSRGTRYQLFGDTTGRTGFLVDLESADSVPLGDLLTKPLSFYTGAVSEGDRWLLITDGSRAFVVDLQTFGPAMAVEAGETARNVQFGPEGRFIVYIRDAAGGELEVVTQELPEGGATTVGPPGPWLGARAFPSGVLVAWQDGTLFRIGLDGSAPVPIFEESGELFPQTVDPAEETMLVRRLLSDQTSWFLVALDGSSAAELTELGGFQQMHPRSAARWALFAAAFEPLQGDPGTPYVGLDLKTGAVFTLLTQDETGIYRVAPSASSNGRYHLVQSVAPESGRLWLLDAAEASGALVAESAGNAVGVFSPDGCYLAVSTFAALGEGRQGQVEVRDLRSGEVMATIADAVLLGWARA